MVFTDKIIKDRKNLAQRLHRFPRPMVFTNGCFDILHRGHVDYLTRSATFGSCLIVGVNDDGSVRRLNKGENRPINCLRDRMEVLAGLECVDWIVPFHEDTPLDIIQLLAPEQLVKGGDWPVEKIVGAKLVIENGGQVHSLQHSHPHSTTKLINQIKQI